MLEWAGHSVAVGPPRIIGIYRITSSAEERRRRRRLERNLASDALSSAQFSAARTPPVRASSKLLSVVMVLPCLSRLYHHAEYGAS